MAILYSFSFPIHRDFTGNWSENRRSHVILEESLVWDDEGSQGGVEKYKQSLCPGHKWITIRSHVPHPEILRYAPEWQGQSIFIHRGVTTLFLNPEPDSKFLTELGQFGVDYKLAICLFRIFSPKGNNLRIKCNLDSFGMACITCADLLIRRILDFTSGIPRYNLYCAL